MQIEFAYLEINFKLHSILSIMDFLNVIIFIFRFYCALDEVFLRLQETQMLGAYLNKNHFKIITFQLLLLW